MMSAASCSLPSRCSSSCEVRCEAISRMALRMLGMKFLTVVAVFSSATSKVMPIWA